MEIIVTFLMWIYFIQKNYMIRDFEFPIWCEHSIPPNEKIKKLMSIVYDKKNYTIPLLNLKYGLEKGLILKKYIMWYMQNNLISWNYINFNNLKKSECSKYKDIFGVDQSKLSNNSRFGKQIEENVKYKDTRIANNEEKAKK